MIATGYSVASSVHPDRNEDAWFVTPNGRAAGVFDGVGGYPGSEVLAHDSAEYFSQELSRLACTATLDDLSAIYDGFEAHVRKTRQYHGLATTAIIAYVADTHPGERPVAHIIHSGDSRGLIARGDRFVHVTLDHIESTAGEDESTRRMIQRHLGTARTMLDVDPHYWRHVYDRSILSQCLRGGRKETMSPSRCTIPVMPGDRVVLMSDGIHDNLTTSEIRRLIQGNPKCVPHKMIDAALVRSKEPHETVQMFLDEESIVKHFRPKPDDMTATIQVVG